MSFPVDITVILIVFHGITAFFAARKIFDLRENIESLRKELYEANHREPQKAPPSQELTAFLQDVQTCGYGFVRVDPVSVFHRSPKELSK